VEVGAWENPEQMTAAAVAKGFVEPAVQWAGPMELCKVIQRWSAH